MRQHRESHTGLEPSLFAHTANSLGGPLPAADYGKLDVRQLFFEAVEVLWPEYFAHASFGSSSPLWGFWLRPCIRDTYLSSLDEGQLVGPAQAFDKVAEVYACWALGWARRICILFQAPWAGEHKGHLGSVTYLEMN